MDCESCGERLNPFTDQCDPCYADYRAQFAESDERADDRADRHDLGLLERLMEV